MASGWVLGHMPARDVFRTPFLLPSGCNPQAAPPGPVAQARGGQNRRQLLMRGLQGHLTLSCFSFSPLWGTVCGFRWSSLVSQLPPELHQWTDLPLFCHRAQGLWYEGVACLFVCFWTSSKVSGPSQLYPNPTLNCTPIMGMERVSYAGHVGADAMKWK